MAVNGRKGGFVDNTGKGEATREDSGRFLQVERQEYKGKTYITIGWCFEGKNGKTIHAQGKQVWMKPEEFKDIFEAGFVDAYKALGGKVSLK